VCEVKRLKIMSQPKLILFFLALAVPSLFGERHEVQLDAKYLFAWNVDANGTIQIEVTGETLGYVGIGLNMAKGRMDKAEMAIGGVHEDGRSYYGIYIGHKHKVLQDRKKKWTLVEANQNATHTCMKYERPLTGTNLGGGEEDDDIVPITDKDMYVIWALGKSDKLKKHHGHGKLKVNLINPDKEYLQSLDKEMFNFFVDFW